MRVSGAHLSGVRGRDSEARPQRRPMAAIEDKELLGISVVQRVHDAAP
jgi:hypothetical protein